MGSSVIFELTLSNQFLFVLLDEVFIRIYMNLKTFAQEFLLFGIKQAYACMFGGFLLFIMIATSIWYPLESMHRYDFIFVAAAGFQLLLVLTKLETVKESLIIIVFHIVATGMELFKTSDAIGSWQYPEDYIFGIGNVPLFTGFMYSAVGSYIARVWRIFNFQYSGYPNKRLTFGLIGLIYINFFSHHYIWDLRWLLIAVSCILFFKTTVYYRIIKTHRKMPLLLGWFLVALFIWLAENIATFANIWIYPNQHDQWQIVSFSKLTAWFLLMQISFVLVSTINSIHLGSSSQKALIR